MFRFLCNSKNIPLSVLQVKPVVLCSRAIVFPATSIMSMLDVCVIVFDVQVRVKM